MSRLTPYPTTGKAGRAGASGSCRMVAQVGLHHPPSNGGSHPDAWSRHCAPGPLLCSPRPPSVKAIPKLMKSSRTPANSPGCPEARHLISFSTLCLFPFSRHQLPPACPVHSQTKPSYALFVTWPPSASVSFSEACLTTLLKFTNPLQSLSP